MATSLYDMSIPSYLQELGAASGISGRGVHATTAYGILRMLGVKLGKMDYLGQMRMGG